VTLARLTWPSDVRGIAKESWGTVLTSGACYAIKASTR
jgi:hypothetical protein